MRYKRRLLVTAGMIMTILACVFSAHAQVTTGNVRGIVKDASGGLVPNAKVTITSNAAGTTQSAQTTGQGEYQFNNLLAGTYTIRIEATNFKPLSLTDVTVKLNDTTDVPAQLQVGQITNETVEVSAAGAELVDTTSTNLSKQFNERQVVELAQTGAGLGVYNLALISPGVTSSGGVGVGSGGAVGGQRPRNNNFVVDGIDNNDKSVTGPQVYISPESVGEFSILTNQFSAEFARSGGGQFIVATKSGTNQFHGQAYEYTQNRHLDALDTSLKNAGIVRDTNAGDLSNPRFDFNRFGGDIGGPILKNKLFFYGLFERFATGNAASAAGILSPTAAGYATLATLSSVSKTNLGILQTYSPAAATASGTIQVAGVNIPVGNISVPSPSFNFNYNFVTNIDYTQSEKTQHRGRFIYNRARAIDNTATFPQFFINEPDDSRLFSYTLLHTFTSNLTSETRLAYRRNVNTLPSPNPSFGGLDVFPNIGLLDLNSNIGPDPNGPQSRIENNYQVVQNLTYLFGNHSAKFGGDFRKIISPQVFVQRQRGDYQYTSTGLFLTDQLPDFLAERNVGASTFYGDQKLFFAYAQDDWRFRPNLTLNMGIKYSYQGEPAGSKLQALNSAASVPGLITFGVPKAEKANFAPVVGFAYSPNYTSGYLGRLFGNSGQTSIRGGFSMAYDYIFDNLYILSSPPQAQQTVDCPGDPRCGPTSGFLAAGGIKNVAIATSGNVAGARAATSTFIPDQSVPYSYTWTGSIQRQFAKDYSLEIRYVGTRGIHLLTQNRLNVLSKVTNTPGGFIPTVFSVPTASQASQFTTTLGQINARPRIDPTFAAAGFTSNIVSFESNGNSIYHGGSVQLQRRFSQGMQLSAAYTYSHLIDDTTAEVFSTVLSPRRVQDFRNLSAERADSALDHRHRFVFSGIYDVPFFRNSSSHLVRTIAGGFSLATTYTVESGEKATVLSNADANLNGDTAPDRSIINPNGVVGTSSAVTPYAIVNGQFVKTTVLLPSGAINPNVVVYVANNPNAQYIQAQRGALYTAGRNTLQLPRIDNVDFTAYKNFAVKESMRIQFRADFFNLFNHPQYVPGSIRGGEAVTSTGATSLIATGSSNFNDPSSIFSSHPRAIQLSARFIF